MTSYVSKENEEIINGEVVNVNIKKFDKLITPVELFKTLPITSKIKDFVIDKRSEIQEILEGKDKRKLIIVGPCSIHNIEQAKEYGRQLKIISDVVKDKILIVMRVYFEKPRTTIGWKGLINDPDLDNTFNINKGLRLARDLLIYLNSIGVPCGYEVLDTFTPQYISELISWGAIGARTTESQVHRQLVSGCSFPVGFKNSRTGDVDVAAEAIVSAAHPHCFYGITYTGESAIVHTTGNQNCHVILRGGKGGPNYELIHVNKAKDAMRKNHLLTNVMIDCSHGNSGKNYKMQPVVFDYICNQLKINRNYTIGMMIESNLVEGKQKLIFGEKTKLIYGKSITDSCININTTKNMMLNLYQVL